MTADKIIDSIKINFRASNAQEVRMAAFLRSQKDAGKELKSEIMKAVYSFLDTFAVGADPKSTLADVETAFITSMIALSSQMSSLTLYCRVDHTINLESDSWRTFGLLPSPIAALPEADYGRQQRDGALAFDLSPSTFRSSPVSDIAALPKPPASSTETVGQRLSRDNQERSDEIDREVLTPSIENNISLIPLDESANEEEEDDDYDPDDDLTNEEYAAKMLALIPNNQVRIVD